MAQFIMLTKCSLNLEYVQTAEFNGECEQLCATVWMQADEEPRVFTGQDARDVYYAIRSYRFLTRSEEENICMETPSPEEAFHQGYLSGLTRYAGSVNHPTLKRNNQVLKYLIENPPEYPAKEEAQSQVSPPDPS